MTKKMVERLVVVLVVLLAVSVAVSGQVKGEYWAKIPGALKAHLITTDYSGSRALSIMCFALTEQTAKLIWTDIPTVRNMFESTLGGHCMLVYVGPYGANEYFWPGSFDYTQEHTQYTIGYGDYYAMSDAFGGAEMKADTIAWGIIRIPDGIDTSKIFKIWYDDESAPVGPIDFDDASKKY